MKLLHLLVFCIALNVSAQNEFSPEFIKTRSEKVTAWQLANPLHNKADWTNGAFYAGVFEAYKFTKKQWIKDSLLAMGNSNNWKPYHRFDHADDIVISQTYINLYNLDKNSKYIQASIDTLYKLQKQSGNEVKNHGITWWWCDALFMAPPTLAMAAKLKKDPSFLKTNDVFFKECYDLLYNKDEHLFARDNSYLKDKNGNQKLEANGKKIFWSRGNGWVMGGLVRLLNEMPKDYPTRKFYLDLYKEMAYALLKHQQADGLWRSSLLDPESYPGGEASGTGFDIYAFAWGVNNNILPKKDFLPAIKKGWLGLNSLLTESGKVGWTQPIGADPRRNFNSESFEVFGAGAYLLAASEVIKLKN
jgi:unsaturated rhamnogalacturonyl hydrolase